MDISMPRMNGLDATRIIRRELPECQVVIVSMNDREIASHHAREVDAAAYVAKSETPHTLLSTIEKIVGLNGDERLKKSTASGSASLRESDEGGGPERLIVVNIDVTERRETESTLRENERRYREMIDAAGGHLHHGCRRAAYALQPGGSGILGTGAAIMQRI